MSFCIQLLILASAVSICTTAGWAEFFDNLNPFNIIRNFWSDYEKHLDAREERRRAKARETYELRSRDIDNDRKERENDGLTIAYCRELVELVREAKEAGIPLGETLSSAAEAVETARTMLGSAKRSDPGLRALPPAGGYRQLPPGAGPAVESCT